MKKLFLFLILLQSVFTMAQAPQKMAYQSVVRNASNQIVANQSIGVKISIVEGALTGTTVYSETHTTTTNANGLFTLEAGGGTPTTGTFSAINWGNGSHYIKSEIDLTGGSNYILSGTSELMSVPYALYALNAGNIQSLTIPKMISGVCSAGGNVINGTGFTVVNYSTGFYYVQFNSPFTTPPIVTASPIVTSNSQIDINQFVSIGSITINGFWVYTKNNTYRANDISFSFIAMSN